MRQVPVVRMVHLASVEPPVGMAQLAHKVLLGLRAKLGPPVPWAPMERLGGVARPDVTVLLEPGVPTVHLV